ncbi:copper chaperone [Qipengyuania flava]|jgi:copper chaperone|uniref:Copper chaperone n=1 Tax=Qipengyuania flava TaxID=192812 RepID=A0A5P6N827_9SPHN|nr:MULTISPECIES: heavy-metal-associated domain-containing protein [Qipengyuania]KZX52492.1 heavy metal transport/detoxification protein [Erythrobacter sp. HI00D59]MAB44038.1 copper chaperone [Sphingomonadaceae bacterium]MCD1591067.1 heavy-metal-associated domain-containing protein [Qipengyuania citrea]QFI62106.1 copper chaperone [Qipengyuania flava]|tara:strand:+ start:107 stop:304 length:198 start_codon:yes stop_codon:yes gene_type:complete
MQFALQNMSCGSCVRHINQALAAVDPGAKVEADTVSRKITVDTKASQGDVEKALADAGYPATALQ